MVATGAQAFSASMLQFSGTSTVSITNSYLEVDLAVSAIEMDTNSNLILTYCSVYNTTTTIATNGLVYLNSIPPTGLTHAIGSNSFLCASTGASGQAAISIAQTGQVSLIQNNGFAVRVGSTTSNAIISGAGSTLTPVYYFGNTSAPTSAANIGPISATFAPLSLTNMPNNTLAGVYTCITGVTQTIVIPGMTSTGLIIPIYVHPTAGGAAQWIISVTPGTNQVVIVLGQTAATTETIIWSVARFS